MIVSKRNRSLETLQGVRDPDGNVILLHHRYKPYEQV
jgi:hypothetical protein